MGRSSIIFAIFCVGATHAFNVALPLRMPSGYRSCRRDGAPRRVEVAQGVPRMSAKSRSKMVDMPNPYEVLGVTKQSTLNDIKKAYRKKAQMFHPDVNREPGAEETFIVINQAWEILGDQELRRMYDFAGRAGLPDDFAERVDFMNKKGGTQFANFINIVESSNTIVVLNLVPMVGLLLVMSLYPDVLHDLVLGKRPGM